MMSAFKGIAGGSKETSDEIYGQWQYVNFFHSLLGRNYNSAPEMSDCKWSFSAL
ncbi:hypothetical protein BMS3Bbin12_00280 [bacterium BMS3Bbin12]|nr:hypothetical protein BMS3Bbin12_00280 [bacterium BMS3Bbin12]GBE51381.1 hypothetical protein BMS3Bbin13_02339 [bacterium BMS3Bbin13]